jgi:hypothetical protein
VKDREAITILAEYPFVVELDRRYRMSLTVRGNQVLGEIDGSMVADVVDDSDPLPAGGVGLIVSEGTLSSGAVRVEPLS